MKNILLKDLFRGDFANQTVSVSGWARSIRSSKAIGFIELNDGSYFKNVQIVFEREAVANFDVIAKQNVGAAFTVTGVVEMTPEAKQPFEIKAKDVTVSGESTPEYPCLLYTSDAADEL